MRIYYQSIYEAFEYALPKKTHTETTLSEIVRFEALICFESSYIHSVTGFEPGKTRIENLTFICHLKHVCLQIEKGFQATPLVVLRDIERHPRRDEL